MELKWLQNLGGLQGAPIPIQHRIGIRCVFQFELTILARIGVRFKHRLEVPFKDCLIIDFNGKRLGPMTDD